MLKAPSVTLYFNKPFIEIAAQTLIFLPFELVVWIMGFHLQKNTHND